MAFSTFIILVCVFSFDWAKWGDYRKCDKVEYDIGDGNKGSYCKKGEGCPKGYYNEPGTENDGKGTCKKCKEATFHYGGSFSAKYSDLCDKLTELVPSEEQRKGLETAQIDCYCKKGKVKTGSCPAVAKAEDDRRKDNCAEDGNKDDDECKDKKYYQTENKNCKKDKDYKGNEQKGCKESLKGKRADTHYHGCMYASYKDRNSYFAVWAFILMIVLIVVFVVVIIVVIIVLILMCLKKKPTEKVEVYEGNQTTPTTTRGIEASAEASPRPDDAVVGPYVVVKITSHELRTKNVKNGPQLAWGETLVFPNLGNEDEDAEFQLWNQETQTQLGKAVERIVEYINKKTHVSVTLKDSSGVVVGVLETDIEIKLDEEKNPPEVTGEIFVDKFNKA